MDGVTEHVFKALAEKIGLEPGTIELMIWEARNAAEEERIAHARQLSERNTWRRR